MIHRNSQATLKNGIVCDYCGARKAEASFCIGASSKADWCMIEGTGNMACPSCYQKASLAGQAAVDAHVASMGGAK